MRRRRLRLFSRKSGLKVLLATAMTVLAGAGAAALLYFAPRLQFEIALYATELSAANFVPTAALTTAAVGIAREVGALNGCSVEGPDIYPVEEQTGDQLSVEVEAPEGCPRYIGRVIRESHQPGAQRTRTRFPDP
ncbi:MAG: hypothetical protein P8Z42_11680 [Anaerolineales bacterium]